MTVLHATARRSGKWWTVQGVEYPGAISQVRRLDQAEEMIAEAIEFVAEIDRADFQVVVLPVIDEQVAAELAESRELRQQAQDADRRAGELIREAARGMAEQGLTVRDIGVVLDVSYQRAHQLLEAGQ